MLFLASLVTSALFFSTGHGGYDGYVVFIGEDHWLYGSGVQCRTDSTSERANKGEKCIEKVGNDWIYKVKICGFRCVQMWDGENFGKRYLGEWCNFSFNNHCRTKKWGHSVVTSYNVYQPSQNPKKRQTGYVQFYRTSDESGPSCIENGREDGEVTSVNRNHGCLEVVGNDNIRYVMVCGFRCVEMWANENHAGGSYGRVCNYDLYRNCIKRKMGNGEVSSYKVWHPETPEPTEEPTMAPTLGNVIKEVNGQWVRKGSLNHGGEFIYTRSVTTTKSVVLTREQASMFSVDAEASVSLGGTWNSWKFESSVKTNYATANSVKHFAKEEIVKGESQELVATCKDMEGTEYIWQYQYRTITNEGDLGPIVNTADFRCIGDRTVVPKCTPWDCVDEHCTLCASEENEGEAAPVLSWVDFNRFCGINAQESNFFLSWDDYDLNCQIFYSGSQEDSFDLKADSMCQKACGSKLNSGGACHANKDIKCKDIEVYFVCERIPGCEFSSKEDMCVGTPAW